MTTDAQTWWANLDPIPGAVLGHFGRVASDEPGDMPVEVWHGYLAEAIGDEGARDVGRAAIADVGGMDAVFAHRLANIDPDRLLTAMFQLGHMAGGDWVVLRQAAATAEKVSAYKNVDAVPLLRALCQVVLERKGVRAADV